MSYSPENFQSIADFIKIQEGGLSVLGFLHILKDILGGKEGIVNLKELASSLGVTMQKIYGFIGILEDAFIIRTTAIPEGRHIELAEYHSSEECPDFPDGWLKEHGILTESSPLPEKINPAAYKSAVYIGDHFAKVRNFYLALKSTLNDLREINFPLDDFEAKDANTIHTLAKALFSMNFLETAEYHRKPSRSINAKLSAAPEARGFISGKWLEYWAHSKITSMPGGTYTCARNLNVTLPENERFEFDLLVRYGKSIVWIECKTGKYSSYLTKYSRIAELLGLSPNNALLVTAEAPVIDASGITCCSLDDFSESFRKACT